MNVCYVCDQQTKLYNMLEYNDNYFCSFECLMKFYKKRKGSFMNVCYVCAQQTKIYDVLEYHDNYFCSFECLMNFYKKRKSILKAEFHKKIIIGSILTLIFLSALMGVYIIRGSDEPSSTQKQEQELAIPVITSNKKEDSSAYLKELAKKIACMHCGSISYPCSCCYH